LRNPISAEETGFLIKINIPIRDYKTDEYET